MGRNEGPDGFAAFANARTPQLMRTAWVLTGDWYLAQDVVQETLARLFQAWNRVERVDNPAAYAQVVLVRTYLAMRRRRSFFERPTGEFDEAEASTDDLELRVTLQAALAKLTPRDRAVLVLRFLCDRSVDQVAADLDRSPAAVRTMSKRALDRLRAVLGDKPALLGTARTTAAPASTPPTTGTDDARGSVAR